MCGIAGGFGGLSKLDVPGLARGIIQKIRYRGPNGQGVEYFDNGFFVHLRLATIDLTSGGAQPKWCDDRRFCISFSGEIYNYRELRIELAALGHVFKTESDTEVLLKVWEEWGPDGLKRCIGMYAFALYDARVAQLYLARDTYGIKPLYVAETDGGVRFASTYPALTAFPDCPRRADAKRAFEFVRYGMLDSADGTLVEGVRPIQPGVVETWDISGRTAKLASRRTITKPIYKPKETLSFAQASEQLREALMLSVRLHMRSDVPFGFALSGGIDSSAIVCAARLIEPDADLMTFTYEAQGQEYNEETWATIVSDHARTIPHSVHLDAQEAVDTLEDVVRTHGTPTSSMSTQAQRAVFETAHKAGMIVVLDGQGADEMFGGYPHHLGAALAGHIRRREFSDAFRMLLSTKRTRTDQWRASASWMLDHLLPQRAKLALRHLAGLEHAPAWIDAEWVKSRCGALTVLGPRLDSLGSDVLGERLAHDLTELIIPDLLLYEDRNSMRFSVESRVPFLALPMTEAAYSVPSHFHLGTDAQSKRLLRSALRGILPEQIRMRIDKGNFAVPQGEWLIHEGSRIEKLLQSDTAKSIRLFQHQKLMDRWRAIDGPKHPDLKYVWRWMGLIHWTNSFQIEWE